MPNQGSYIKGKVTQRVFDAAKVLLESETPIAEVAHYLKLSINVIRVINNSETYDEYKAAMYERSSSARKRRAAAAIAANEKAAEAKQAPETKPEEKKECVQPATQVVEHRQSVTVQATHFMETKLDILIEQMKLLNAKVGAIIDDLYGVGGGKGGASA